MTDLANLFMDQRMSSLPIGAKFKYKYFKTICEHTSDNAPTVSNSSFFEVVIIQARRSNCVPLLCLFVSQFAIPVYALVRMSFRVVGSRDSFCVKFLPLWYSSVAVAEIRDSNIFSTLIDNVFVRCTFTLSASQKYTIKK